MTTAEQAKAMQDRVKRLGAKTADQVTIRIGKEMGEAVNFTYHAKGYDEPTVTFGSETRDQQAVVSWFKATCPEIYESGAFFAVPNEGKRTRATASRMKAEGMFPGVSDLVLLEPRGGFHGMVLEMKFGKNTLSKDQKKWLEARKESGYYVAACWTYDQATNELSNYLKLK